MQKDLEDKGVIFKDTGSALRENEELFREYFGKIIPPQDNKFSALNSQDPVLLFHDSITKYFSCCSNSLSGLIKSSLILF